MKLYVLFQKLGKEMHYQATYPTLGVAKSAATQMLLSRDAEKSKREEKPEGWQRHHWRIVEVTVEVPTK